jgi:hypothetical protein
MGQDHISNGQLGESWVIHRAGSWSRSTALWIVRMLSFSRSGSSEGSYPFKFTCNQQEVNPRQNHPRGAVRSVDSTFCRLVLRGHLTIVGCLLTLRWWSNDAGRQTATGTSDRRARRHGTAAT